MAGQVAALALVTSTIAFGSLAARAASSEAVRAGSPENEFMLARPVALASLVAARGLADAVIDPVGALFLLPVLIAAGVVWRLGAPGWPLAIVISMLMQIAISMLAYAVQLAVVRYVRRRAAPDDVDGAAAGRGAVAGDAVDARHLGDAGARRAGDAACAPSARVCVLAGRCWSARRSRRWRAASRRQAAWMLLALAVAVACTMLAGGRGRAPRRDGGLGRGGRGLGGGGARAAAAPACRRRRRRISG